MGGRGIAGGYKNSQTTFEDFARIEMLQDIQKRCREMRAENARNSAGIGAGNENMKMRKRCACCKEWTIPAYTSYETCPVCGWIDDPAQNADPYLAEGKNPMCLNQAQMEWKARREN